MAQAIIYCDRCGKIIPPSEIGRGRAIVGETDGLCPACLEGLPPAEREELRRRLSGEVEAHPSRARAPSTRTLRGAEGARGPAEPAQARRSHTGLVVAGLAAGLLGGVAIAVLVAGGNNVEDPASGPDAPGSRPTVEPPGPRGQGTPFRPTPKPPAEPATPAAKRLAEMYRVFNPSFADYTEGRKMLREFLKEFGDSPEAEKAKARLAEMTAEETKQAKAAVAKAAEHAGALASRGRFGDAVKVLDAARERFGASEWFKAEGKKRIASALEGIEKTRLDAAKQTIARAGRLLEAEEFDEADRALAERAGWPEAARERAEDLVAKIASARKAAEEKRRRIDAWLDCLIGMEKAGKTSLTEARAHLERERKRLRELGLGREKDEKLERIERRFRSAKFVEDIAEIALERTKGTMRFRWKGETIAAKVTSVQGGVLKVRTIGGKEETIPISEMAAEEVVARARIMRGSSKDPVKAGSYYFLRGDMKAARKAIDGLTSEKALALEEDIELVASALEAKKARLAAAEAARREAEAARAAAAEAARRKAALEAARAKALVGHWTFDSKDNPGADSSGKGRHGDVFGAKWTAKGKLGGALEFDGQSNFVDLPDGFADFTRGFTVAVWAYPTGNRNWARFIDLGNGAMIDNIFFARRGSGTGTRFEIQDGSMGSKTIDTANVIQFDRWQHFAATIDEAGNAVIYRDGVQLDARTTGIPRNVTRTANYIGKSNWGRDSLYQGLMDDVRVYNRALTADEMRSLAEGRAPAPVSASGPTEGLVGHWAFDEGKGREAADSSGNGNTGRLENMDDKSWVAGKVGPWALEFDGTDDYVAIANEANFDLTDRITVAAWIRVASFTRRWQVILAKGGRCWRLQRDKGRRSLEWACSGLSLNRIGNVQGSVTVDDGKWHHVAGVYDGTEICLYVDGKVDVSRRASRTILTNDHKVYIGDNADGGGRCFHGIIDDVRVYDRALSAEEIRALSGGTAVTGPAVTRPAVTKPAVTKPAVTEPAATEPKVSLPSGPKKPLPGETGMPGEWAPGLVCEIFKGRGFTNRVGVRIDASPVRDFGTAPPDLGLAPGDYSFRWSGWFLAPTTGQYFFNGPAGFTSVKVDGRSALGVGGGVRLARGLHEFRATAKGGKTELKVRTPDPPRELDALLYHKVPEPGSIGPFAKLVSGLKAEYFADDECRRPVAAGTVEGLDFKLDYLPACSRRLRSRFSMRITGYLLAPREGEYTFKVGKHRGHGVRVHLHDALVVDTWGGGAGKDTGKRRFPAGYTKLKIHFRNAGGAPAMQLKWQGPGHGEQPVPAHALFMEAPKPKAAKRSGLAPGVKGQLYREGPPAGEPAAERIDPYLSFDWSDKRPAPNVPQESFSAVWRGFLVVPETGPYMFQLEHDGGGVQLSVGGRSVVNRPKAPKGVFTTKVLRLPRGQVPLGLAYTQLKPKKTLVKLSWIGPNFPLRPVGAGELAHEGEFARAAPEAKPKEPPQGKPASAKPGADKAPGAVPGPDLVGSGGFEEAGSGGEIARGWRKGQWGPKKGGFTARLDRTNSHGGGRSLVVRANGGGIHPGAATTLTSSLKPGKYEIRFWASADVGKTAEVRAHLAGREALSGSVGEDWKELVATVEITGKKPRPSLRLYTTATKVRVWFDDVAVRARPGP